MSRSIHLLIGAIAFFWAIPANAAQPQKIPLAELAKALDGKDPSARLAAVEELGCRGEAALPALLRALRDEDVLVRQAAAEGIRAMRPSSKDAVPALIEALKDSSDSVRTVAAEALGWIGPSAKDAVPELDRACRDRDALVQVAARGAIARIRPEQAAQQVEPLIHALKGKDAQVRAAAVENLGWVGKEAVPPLLEMLFAKAGSDEVRGAAQEALARIGAPAVPQLLERMKGLDERAVERAARTLALMGPRGKDAVPELVKLIGRTQQLGEPNYPFEAGLALKGIGAPAVAPLVALAIDPDLVVQVHGGIRAELILDGIKSDVIVPELVAIFEKGDARTKWQTAKMLAARGRDASGAVPALVGALNKGLPVIEEPDGTLPGGRPLTKEIDVQAEVLEYLSTTAHGRSPTGIESVS